MPIYEPIELNLNSRELKKGYTEFRPNEPRFTKYPGKIINGKPTLLENVELQENTDIIIMLKNEERQKATSKPNTKEIEKRRAMVKSLKGCLAGFKVNLNEIRDERIAKRGMLD